MNERDRDQMKKLLKDALPPVDADSVPAHDLWPAMLRRLDEESEVLVTAGQAGFNWAWFDGALAAGLVLLVASFPASIPLLLYYL
jgi:hypothetical protein